MTYFTLYMLLFVYYIGATHIVHHYVPGQPFYIRELVYRRVKSLLIDQGVRINDFGAITRGNLYYDDSLCNSDGSITKSKDKIISKNHTNIYAMVLWLLSCSSVGVASYVLFDVWATAALGRRIVRKYVQQRGKDE